MKIGIFDSGLGGLQILKAIRKLLPKYDYIYYGDTKNMPYGSKTQDDIFKFTKIGMDFLFKQNAKLIIIACNTASTNTLRKLQKEYLPKHFPDRKILGVIIPTTETAVKSTATHIGIIATPSTVNSGIYITELQKLKHNLKITQISAPGLATNIENNQINAAKTILKDAINYFNNIGTQTIILGCTHYGMLNKYIEVIAKKNKVINQNNIIPDKLKEYLKNHPEVENQLSHSSSTMLYVTKITKNIKKTATQWFIGSSLKRVV